MKVLYKHEALKELCRATGQWGAYFDIYDGELSPEIEFNEVLKAAPWLDRDKDVQVIMDRDGFVLFDSQEECEDTFSRTVGDDGPTKRNPYEGKVRVYMLTCSPAGEWMNENT